MSLVYLVVRKKLLNIYLTDGTKLNYLKCLPVGRQDCKPARYFILEEIGHWPEIKSIFLGQTRRGSKNVGQLRLTLQSSTTSGIKCLAKGKGSVQEVFIVSSSQQGDGLEKKLKEHFSGGG